MQFSQYMCAEKIRVLIVDDHKIVRDGMRAFLEEFDHIEIVGDVDNGREALQFTESVPPDVVLMDLMMPVMDGIEATRQITSKDKTVRILIMTSFIAEEMVFSSIKAGGYSFVMKDTSPEELVKKIESVHRGEASLDTTTARKMLKSFQHAGQSDALSTFETEILSLLGEGQAISEVSQQIGASETDLHRKIFQIVKKLHQLP
jgi:two-component system, NarL family, response regulator LiaR